MKALLLAAFSSPESAGLEVRSLRDQSTLLKIQGERPKKCLNLGRRCVVCLVKRRVDVVKMPWEIGLSLI